MSPTAIEESSGGRMRRGRMPPAPPRRGWHGPRSCRCSPTSVMYASHCPSGESSAAIGGPLGVSTSAAGGGDSPTGAGSSTVRAGFSSVPVKARKTSGSGSTATGPVSGSALHEGGGTDSPRRGSGCRRGNRRSVAVTTARRRGRLRHEGGCRHGVGCGLGPLGLRGDPLSSTMASSAPNTAARLPPAPAKITAGRRQKGTEANRPRSIPVRTRGPRSRGGATWRRPPMIRRCSAKAASVARQWLQESRWASSHWRSASVRSPVSDALISSS